MTELQLKIQQRADKTLSFGCFVSWSNGTKTGCEHVVRVDYQGGERFIVTESGQELWLNAPGQYYTKYEVIGHPMNRGRLLYFMYTKEYAAKDRIKMFEYCEDFPETLQQTVLERPAEFQEVVLRFLESIGIDLIS